MGTTGGEFGADDAVDVDELLAITLLLPTKQQSS
jgi:hypothetical protein